MFVYCTLFVRDSVMRNQPDTLNSDNFPPVFCNKKHFTKSGSETTSQPDCDSNWNF